MKDVFSLGWEKRYDDHLWQYELTCRECGQSYFFQFLEKIDWDTGMDDQLSVYIPIKNDAALEKLKNTSYEDIPRHTPRLQKHTPLGSTTTDLRWITDGSAP